MSILDNRQSYTLTDSDLVDIRYNELDLSVKFKKLTADSSMLKTVYIDETM